MIEPLLSTLLYEKPFQKLVGRGLHLLGTECIAW